MQVLRVTQALLAELRRRSIHHHVEGGVRWQVGENIGVDALVGIEPFAQIFQGRIIPRALGAFSYSHSEFGLYVQVARYCSIGKGVAWMGPSHPHDWASTSPVFYDHGLPATADYHRKHDPSPPPPEPFDLGSYEAIVGNDVWIGDGAMIGAGVTIGDGAVIGARSLVLEDVPPYAVMVGSPARQLRSRIGEALIPRYLAARWWDYQPKVLQRLPASDPARFMGELEDVIARDKPARMAPHRMTQTDWVAAAGG